MMRTVSKVAILFFTVLLALASVSCDLFSGFNKKPIPIDDFDTLEENFFYAQNMETRRYYKVEAEMLFEGEKCVIWAEISARISQSEAEEIANEYDNAIRPCVVDAFSKKDFTDSSEAYHFEDMLDYANWLAYRDDKKLTILLLDIKDGFTNPRTDSYVAGYFFSGNFQPAGKIVGTTHYSNGRDMIYMDTHPGLDMERRQTYATFAHELQHLINYVTSVQMRRQSLMDIWIDEGLSSQAEYLYLGHNPEDKCEWFSKDQEGTIAKGNNFFVWGNHEEKRLSILDDYATVYLFFRWLYLQANDDLKSHIFYDIITSSDADYKAVANIARKINPEWSGWEPLLRSWLAANYFPKNRYGYTGDYDLQETIKVRPIAGSSVSLYPGEGVYSVIDNDFNSNQTTINIRYAGLSDGMDAINTSPPYRGDILLTFNANTSNAPATRPETGSLTGVPPPSSRMAGESSQTKKITGPFVIDAADLLGRDKW
ncbi:MAG: hypothetical protein LBI06_03420 [Treponema sp.]|nr:hypothetical protein [Treponema sp.]